MLGAGAADDDAVPGADEDASEGLGGFPKRPPPTPWEDDAPIK